MDSVIEAKLQRLTRIGGAAVAASGVLGIVMVLLVLVELLGPGQVGVPAALVVVAAIGLIPLGLVQAIRPRRLRRCVR